MNADAFRHLYNYHFLENRNLWDTHIVPLTQEQFLQPSNYSVGSVRNQVVHLMNVDDNWFSDLRGVEVGEWLNPDDFNDRDTVRAYWDKVEQSMRDYLATLQDEKLLKKPYKSLKKPYTDLYLWQVLIHVINHGTDHRAQLLRLLNDLEAETRSQDYIFYCFDNP